MVRLREILRGWGLSILRHYSGLRSCGPVSQTTYSRGLGVVPSDQYQSYVTLLTLTQDINTYACLK